jgi:hypothetical protein
MRGFDFFCKSEISSRYGDSERDIIAQTLKLDEAVFLDDIRDTLIASSASLDMLIERHGNADMAFITAFLTGTNKNRSPGWGAKYYREGEIDVGGNRHHEGDEISPEENTNRNRSLEDLLHGIGYAFVPVMGHYGDDEHSYCVLNYVEDTRRFIDDMMGAAALWNQDSVLIVPRRGFGDFKKDSRPFLYYPKDNRVRYAKSERPVVAITEYYTVIGRDHIEYPFDFNIPAEEIAFGGLRRVVLAPIRSGYEGAWVASNRSVLREFFGWYLRRR